MMEPIDVSKLDGRFKYDIAERPGGEHFKRCFACGTCTSSCPVADITPEYSPMRIVRMALLGMREEVLKSKEIWLCSLCYTCYATCPQDVRFRNIIEVLRDMAVLEGHVAPDFSAKIEHLDKLSQSIRAEMVKFLFDKDNSRFNTIQAQIDELKEL